jgi:hypothetical protein
MDCKGQVRILEIGGSIIAIFESLVSPVWHACLSFIAENLKPCMILTDIRRKIVSF